MISGRSFVVPFAFLASYLVAAAAPFPNRAWIPEAVRVYHCPFNVKASIASDFTSLDVAYTTSDAAKNLFGTSKVTCFVKVLVQYDDTKNQVGTKEIEYKWSGQHVFGRVDTQIAWDDGWGPTQFHPVNFTGTASTTRNTTGMTISSCDYSNKLRIFNGAEINVQTTFSTVTSPLDVQGTLTQSFKLSWLGDCVKEAAQPCFWPDRDGNLFRNDFCKSKKWRDGTKCAAAVLKPQLSGLTVCKDSL